MENNGLVALSGGPAKTRTFFIPGDLFEWRCSRCNQERDGSETTKCIPGEQEDVPGPGAANYTYQRTKVYDSHDFELVSPFSLEVPLTLRNSAHARYARTRQFDRHGLRVYNYMGERGVKCEPGELRDQ